MVASFVFAQVEAPDRLGSMGLFFLVAIAVVGPYGVIRVRRILREKAERIDAGVLDGGVDGEAADDLLDGEAAETGADGAGESQPAGSADDLARTIDAIDAGASGDDEEFEVWIPPRPRLNGRSADAATVDALVQDALRRSGVAVITDEATSEGRTLRCRRTPSRMERA